MKILAYTFLMVFTLLGSIPAWAGTATLIWDPNAESDLAGYRVHYGTSPGSYTQVQDAGNVTEQTLNNLTEGQTYYFAVTAYDTSGNESGYSNEVSKLIGTTTGGGGSSPSSGGGGCGMVRNMGDRSGPNTGQLLAGWAFFALLFILVKLQCRLRSRWAV